ncbi:MAG: immunoglobulin domain-containing protein [Phycisphaerales bacterium]
MHRKLLSAAAGLLLSASTLHAGTWAPLLHSPPGAIDLMLLLSDGTVIACEAESTAWFRLTPDSTGNYRNGTWSTIAPMNDSRLYFSSQVLKDGRVWVAGGEYGTGWSSSEIYDPVTDTWTYTNPPTSLLDPAANSPVTGGTQGFSDANSEILPNGSVLVMPVAPKSSGIPLIYNPATNTWAAGPKLVRGVYQDEATWVKLASNMILTIDPFGVNSERYNPGTNTWLNDSNVPVSLYDSFGFELGPGFLLPNGKAFFIGSTGKTAIYTPGVGLANGTWVAGAVVPGSRGVPDGPGAMMVNGKILYGASPVPTSSNHFPSPTTFFEYDYVSNTHTQITGPTGATFNSPTFATAMLDLPDGTVLFSSYSSNVYVYTPTGAPLAAGKPTILSISRNLDGTYHMTGRGLNGISEGACYGDDLQMATNYPLIRYTSGAAVTYARTFNWSSTSVQTGNTVVTTEFSMPAPTGPISLVAVANGIASDPAPAPSVASDPATAHSCPGGSASFTVIAAGTPDFTYQWYRNGVPLSNDAHYTNVNTPTMTILGVTADDAGASYTCKISSLVGSATSAGASLNYCAADFTCSGQVDDADFVVFSSAYNAFACSDPSMPVGCPADLNADGFVDDADFALFAGSYDALLCP